ncbi:MAG: TonB-dependent receptor [Sphingomicrobium sp.]
MLLAITSLFLIPPAAGAQDAPPAPPGAEPAAAMAPPPAADMPDAGEDGGDIVVTGQKPRGSVVGDIPAENILSTRDIRATGATSITELLAAIAPQTGSARGRGGGDGPVILLNGQRISGFQEIRDLPPEALERVEILPEEVALKYGYAADQRVVNIVLRRRFRSTAARLEAGIATAGGQETGEGEVSRLLIGTNGRTQVTLHGEGNSALRESRRDIALQALPTQPSAIDPRDYRTLVGSQALVRGTVTANRTVLGDVSATLTADASHTTGRSLFGVPVGSLAIPATSLFAAEGTSVLLGFPSLGALARDTIRDNGHVGLSLNGTKGRYRWSSTANADLINMITRSDRLPDLSVYQSRVTANDPTANPLSAFTPGLFARDRSRSRKTSAGLDGTLNGPLATLPAGRANFTLKLGADTVALDSVSFRGGIDRSSNLKRTTEDAALNIDLPIAKRDGALGAIGNLTLNANALVQHLSDFGTLTTLGGGANWSPAPRLTLVASFSHEEGAPSINILGDPLLVSPGTRVFDYRRGTTVLVSATTGGNGALLGDRRGVWKLGANWQPAEKVDLRLRADFVSSRLTNPVQTFPGPTPAIEAAFPDRFTRDALGNLTAVDFRPVNYDSARSDVLRIGFDFTKPLKSTAPSQAVIDQLRALRAQTGGGRPDGSGGGGDRGGGGFGRGGGGPFGGGNQRGRLTFSLTDTIAFVDKAVIRPGLPALDFLRGDAANGGTGGGRSRHMVEAQAGYFNNGFGARLSANYKSATRVTGGVNGDLDFAPLATFDLRLFHNPGDNIGAVLKHPWLRGTSIRFEVKNILNEKQRASDRYGAVPLSYQSDLIDPVGRTVGITLRKLFIPARFFQRGGGAGRG